MSEQTRRPVIVVGVDGSEGGQVALRWALRQARVAGDAAGVDVVAKVVRGHAADALLDASRGADLLVVGSRGHGTFAGTLLGSVSQHCAQHARCPIVIVPRR